MKLTAVSLAERVDVRGFVEVESEELRELASKLRKRKPKDSIKAVYRFNVTEVNYPFTADGKPASGYKVEVFPWLRLGPWFKLYLRSWEGGYAWLKPTQVVRLGYGICVDTSNLCTTLLRILGFEAYTVLGVVEDPCSNRVYGHAWTRVLNRRRWYMLETTIHKGRPPVVPLDEAEDKLLLSYKEIASFDERTVEVDRKLWEKYGLKLEKVLGVKLK